MLQAVIIKPQIQWEVEPLICLGYCVFAFYNKIKARSKALAEGICPISTTGRFLDQSDI